MVVTARQGKKTIDPPMSSGVEIDTIKDDEVTEVSREHKNTTKKEDVVIQSGSLTQASTYLSSKISKEDQRKKIL